MQNREGAWACSQHGLSWINLAGLSWVHFCDVRGHRNWADGQVCVLILLHYVSRGEGCLSSHAATEVVSSLLICVLYCHHDYLRTVRFSLKLRKDEKVKNLISILPRHMKIFTAIHPSDWGGGGFSRDSQTWVGFVRLWWNSCDEMILLQYLQRTNMLLWQRPLFLYVGGVGNDRRGHCPVHNWLTQFYRVFLCGHGGVFKPACCRPTNTSASRHRGDHKDFSVWNTVGLWRWVFVAVEEVGVELTPNDLHIQSGGTGLIFWATCQM